MYWWDEFVGRRNQFYSIGIFWGEKRRRGSSAFGHFWRLPPPTAPKPTNWPPKPHKILLFYKMVALKRLENLHSKMAGNLNTRKMWRYKITRKLFCGISKNDRKIMGSCAPGLTSWNFLFPFMEKLYPPFCSTVPYSLQVWGGRQRDYINFMQQFSLLVILTLLYSHTVDFWTSKYKQF